MNAANDWKQTSVDVLFVAAEAIVWFVMARVIATGLEHAYLSQLQERIRLATSAVDVSDATRAADALVIVQRATALEHGPSLLIVLLTAFGAFALMRALTAAKFEGVLGAVVLLASSVVALKIGRAHV